jgi:tRNA splicing endonuclease
VCYFTDDPNFIHSEFLLFIYDTKDVIDVKKLIENERISVSTKKKYLIASIDEEDEIKVLNMEWMSI